MRVAFLAVLALVLFCSSAHASTILGVLYNQDVSGHASVPNSLNVELTAGNHKWVLPPIGVADVGKVFTASAATVGDYPQLDWDQLSYLMTYDKPVTFNFTGNITNFAWKPTEMYTNRFLYSNWEAGFTPPNIYFSSIDRIEVEIAMLSFDANPNNANGVIRWRIYGEPTSAPEPSTVFMFALGSVLLSGPLRRRRAGQAE